MNNPNNVPTRQLLADAALTPGMRVLDVGCAHGLLTRELAAMVGPQGSVTGIDIEEDRLAQARAVAPAPGAAPVEYRAIDLADDLPADLGTFDAIVGRRVLMYLPDARASVAKLVALLGPGGVMAFHEHARPGMPIGTAAAPLHEKAHGWMWRVIESEGGTVDMGLRLPALFEDAGLEQVSLRAEAIALGRGPESDLAPLVRMMAPRLASVGIEERDILALADGLADERAALCAPILFEMAYLAIGRKPATSAGG